MKKKKNDPIMLAIAIGSAVILFLVLPLLFGIVTRTSFGTTIGLVIASAIYFLIIFPNITIIVKENQGVILSNTFKRESSDINIATGDRTIIAQRELQAGFHLKYPWEKQAGDAIDMHKAVLPIEGKGETDYTYVLDDKPKLIRIKYRVIVVPMPGKLINFNRTRPEDIREIATAKVEGFLQGYVGSQGAQGLTIGYDDEQKQKIEKAFSDEFSDHENLDDELANMGIWMRKIIVSDIDPTPEGAKAANLATTIKTMMDSAADIVKASEGQMNFNQAMNLIALTQKDTGAEWVRITGDLFPIGGSQSKKDNKNKKGGDNDDK